MFLIHNTPEQALLLAAALVGACRLPDGWPSANQPLRRSPSPGPICAGTKRWRPIDIILSRSFCCSTGPRLSCRYRGREPSRASPDGEGSLARSFRRPCSSFSTCSIISPAGRCMWKLAGGIFPPISIDTLVLAASVLLSYAGIEMNAVHATQIDAPSRNYPVAILIAAGATLAIYALGTLTIALILQPGQIDLTQSLLVTYRDFFRLFDLPVRGRGVDIALALGAFSATALWIAGPSCALTAVGGAGYLPPFFRKLNRQNIPTRIVLFQGALVTTLTSIFVLMPLGRGDISDLHDPLSADVYFDARGGDPAEIQPEGQAPAVYHSQRPLGDVAFRRLRHRRVAPGFLSQLPAAVADRRRHPVRLFAGADPQFPGGLEFPDRALLERKTRMEAARAAGPL